MVSPPPHSPDTSSVTDMPGRDDPVLQDLVASGALGTDQIAHLEHIARPCNLGLSRLAVGEGLISEDARLRALARTSGLAYLDSDELEAATPDFDDIPPHRLIQSALFPCRLRDGSRCLVVAEPPRPDDPLAARLIAPSGARTLRLAERRTLQNLIAMHSREALLDRAAHRPADHHSCRGWVLSSRGAIAVIAALILCMAVAGYAFPIPVFLCLTMLAVGILGIATLFKTVAFAANLRQGPEPWFTPRPKRDAPLPPISVLVPMYREVEILPVLLHRLQRLTYPKSLLEVVIILEESDTDTAQALAGLTLPHWIRVVVVPDGGIKTKPHAMNYALDFCSGEIIGIYDAEDAPEPDQLTRVARRFQSAGPRVACLQGVLDYYNAKQNWLARCFTIEYATWFRMILPGMRRMGFAIPLGGTTVFVRRSALEHVGAWDAHNVTEDADLGIRLARFGYETEMAPVVTHEEANCRGLPWIRQRSRWLKGYLMTYLVHMRRPGRLFSDLGWWQFLGFQAHFVAAIFQFLLAPVLWSFWLMFFVLPHPLVDGILSHDVLLVLGSLFLTCEVLNVIMYMTAVSAPSHRHLMLYSPTMHIYWPLGTLAAGKAVYETVFKPFFWDKTWHGWSLPKDATGPAAHGPDRAGADCIQTHAGAGAHRASDTLPPPHAHHS